MEENRSSIGFVIYAKCRFIVIIIFIIMIVVAMTCDGGGCAVYENMLFRHKWIFLLLLLPFDGITTHTLHILNDNVVANLNGIYLIFILFLSLLN